MTRPCDERMGLAGRQRFEQEFTWETVIERHYPTAARISVVRCATDSTECTAGRAAPLNQSDCNRVGWDLHHEDLSRWPVNLR